MKLRNCTGELALALSVAVTGCVGGRFSSQDPGSNLDQPTRVVVDHINAERIARKLPPPDWVAQLRPPAVRAALGVARGEQSLKTAAHTAAQQAVTELGRHVWTFATDCTELERFRPPPLALQQKMLLFAAAAIPAAGGHTVVVLVIAEPGPSSLRADQMGGGPGGTNPALETFAHPTVATGSCGDSWPLSPRPPL